MADEGGRSSNEQRSAASGSVAEGLLRIAGAIQLLQKTKMTRTAQEENKMNTNTKELNLNEMEMVNGGSIIGLICVLGLVAAEIGIAVGVGYATKDSDVGNSQVLH